MLNIKSPEILFHFGQDWFEEGRLCNNNIMRGGEKVVLRQSELLSYADVGATLSAIRFPINLYHFVGCDYIKKTTSDRKGMMVKKKIKEGGGIQI
jgi:hypothetical protein